MVINSLHIYVTLTTSQQLSADLVTDSWQRRLTDILYTRVQVQKLWTNFCHQGRCRLYITSSQVIKTCWLDDEQWTRAVLNWAGEVGNGHTATMQWPRWRQQFTVFCIVFCVFIIVLVLLISTVALLSAIQGRHSGMRNFDEGTHQHS